MSAQNSKSQGGEKKPQKKFEKMSRWEKAGSILDSASLLLFAEYLVQFAATGVAPSALIPIIAAAPRTIKSLFEKGPEGAFRILSLLRKTRSEVREMLDNAKPAVNHVVDSVRAKMGIALEEEVLPSSL